MSEAAGQGAGQASAQGLDWPGLMRAGMVWLRLTPSQFWALTPAELALMLGIEPGGGAQAMTRGRLADLAAKFPD
ncbi:rcc01693 family protein [Paracoccus aeridis]|uniref:rcc01693 family protein n=1 Tax=Paracoccus aeridis TaxID=1966466 RepID=UPI0022A75398|nr:rcc01693 family protein [Paracoccus aeridis]